MTRVLGPSLPGWAIPRLLLLIAFLCAAWLAISYLYVPSLRRSTRVTEAVSPNGAFRATVTNSGDYWGWEGFVQVHDNRVPVGPWRLPSQLEEGGTKTIVHLGENGDLVSLHWSDDTSLLVEYPYWFDNPSSDEPREIRLRNIASWRGLTFVLRPIPSYPVVFSNQRPDLLRFPGGPSYWSIDPCGESHSSWADPRRPVHYRYEDPEGNLVFSILLHTQVVDETMVVKDELGNVLLTTHLRPPLHQGEIGTIRLVIPADPGEECPRQSWAPTQSPDSPDLRTDLGPT